MHTSFSKNVYWPICICLYVFVYVHTVSCCTFCVHFVCIIVHVLSPSRKLWPVQYFEWYVQRGLLRVWQSALLLLCPYWYSPCLCRSNDTECVLFPTVLCFMSRLCVDLSKRYVKTEDFFFSYSVMMRFWFYLKWRIAALVCFGLV